MRTLSLRSICKSTPALVIAMLAAACAARTQFTREDDTIAIRTEENLVLRYRLAPGPLKPYVRELRTPGGRQVLLDAPPDHVHHHGLMYAIGVETVDFWGEEPKEKMGRQVPRPGETVKQHKRGGLGRTVIEQVVDWLAPDDKPVLEEQRQLTYYDGEELGATLLTWSSRFSPPADRKYVRLWGRHYFGLGMRFAESMYADGRFFMPAGREGEIVRGTEKITRDSWCAYTGSVDGQPVTVAMFGHPGNPRHPIAWFTMSAPFAYMSATLNLWRRRMLLRAGEKIELSYGVALWDGEVTPAQVEKMYERWLALAPKPENPPGWAATHVNVALPQYGAKIDASSAYGPDYSAAKAVDGNWAVREKHKWNSAANVTPHYLRIDLGQRRTIDRVRIYHEGIMPDGDACTTSDFRIQRSDKPWGPWVDLVEPIINNSEPVTEHVFPATQARYLRLLIQTGEQNDRNTFGRAFEIEVYGPKDALKEPADKR